MEAEFFARLERDPWVCFIGMSGNPQFDATHDAQGRSTVPVAPALTPEQAAVVMNPGTSYSTTVGDYNSSANSWHPIDARNYQYGRSATGADQAVQHANDVGQSAFGTGSNLLALDQGYAADARNRAAPTGDFSQQNAALGQSMNYGQQLAGLQQGPSAAQAQLQAGTNQAIGSQLALARSGRGFGGGAAATGQAEGNLAGIQANQANSSAALRAQEAASWQQQHAANLGNAAGITAAAGSQFGGQAGTNLNAYLQNQGQSDAASLGYLGQGATAYGQGVSQNLQGQSLGAQIRGQEMTGGMGAEDRALRAWAAQQGFNLQQQQADRQQTAALIQGAATVGGGIIGFAGGGPAGAAVGAGVGGAAGRAATG